MPLFVAQLYRLIPIIVFAVALLAIVYAVLWNTRGADRAKEGLLAVLRWFSIIGMVVSVLFTAYAASEHNEMLAWFFGSCLGLFAVMLGIDVVCRRVLKRHERERRFHDIAKKQDPPRR
jgi:cytochrome bd-type quinol oxidase subunit 2